MKNTFKISAAAALAISALTPVAAFAAETPVDSGFYTTSKYLSGADFRALPQEEKKALLLNPSTVMVVGSKVYTGTEIISATSNEQIKDMGVTVAAFEAANGAFSSNGYGQVVAGELKVESVMAINATQVTVNFNQPVDKTDAETAGKVTVSGVTFTGRSLSADGKTLTLTANAAMDVKNAAVVVEPVKSKEDSLVSSTRFVSLLTYEDTKTPDIKSVDSKTASASASSVTVTFSEPIKSLGSVKINGVVKTATGFTAGQTSATFNGLDLDAAKSHTIQFVGLTDQADNVLTNKTVDFTVTKDVAAPTVTLSASTDKDNVIVVEFDKAVTVATAQAALVNGIVKGEVLESVTSGTATAVAPVNGLAKKYEVAVTTPFATKASRNLTVVIPAGIKDALGNEVTASTKTVTLTKDVVTPLISSVKVVKDADAKVTKLVLSTDSSLAVKSAVAAATLKTSLTVVDEDGVLVDSSAWLGGLKQDAITAGDKEISLSFTTPAKLSGKYTVTFAAGLATDEATTPNNLKSKTVTVDFGAASTTGTFEIVAGDVTSPSDNVYAVDFGAAVKGGAVTGSATDLSSYTLNGAALPEGTTVTLNGTKDIAKITLPSESIETSDTAAVFTVGKVQRVTGETVKPLTTTVATKDNVKPVLTNAVLNADGSVSLSFSETLTATPVLSDFIFKANGKTLNGATVATIIKGTGADAGKFVIPNLIAKFDNGTGLASTGDENVYIDVDNDGAYNSTNDILLKTGNFADLAAAGYTAGVVSIKDPAIKSFVIETTGATTVVDAGGNKIKAATTITVK